MNMVGPTKYWYVKCGIKCIVCVCIIYSYNNEGQLDTEIAIKI